MPHRPWKLQETSIFAQIDAFVQRCRDLEEVCEAKAQFSTPKEKDLPVFGGVRGPEIKRAILANCRRFEQAMETMRKIPYNVLDVKATKWHADFNAFKQKVKDLEMILSNLMNSAFEQVTTVPAGVKRCFRCSSPSRRRRPSKRSLEKRLSSSLDSSCSKSPMRGYPSTGTGSTLPCFRRSHPTLVPQFGRGDQGQAAGGLETSRCGTKMAPSRAHVARCARGVPKAHPRPR